MSAKPRPGRAAQKLHRELAAIWDTPPGIGRLAAVNHNVLGKRFMVAALVFFAIGGLLAMLIRAQLATSGSAFVGSDTYNQIFTMHGTVMMFLFAIPMFEGMAIYLLPKMLGARDLAFPRLTAYGFWCYLFGGTILIVAMLAGLAPDGGWFMYTPLTSANYSPGINADVWLLGVTFVEISAICAAVEIIVTVLMLRAPGMSIDRMPIMAWYLLITALMMLFGFPPLILGSILLELERAFGLPFFDPTRGGDALLWQHLFWLFGHPEVYIIFLPAAGAVSMMVPTFARHELVGYQAVVASVIAVAFLSFGLWVHHMFAVGIPHLALAFFSAASGLVAIPTAVQLFAWIATLAQGRPKSGIPMLYLGGFFFVFVVGGLTGVMLAMVPFNLQAHDSHFVVAHLHYVLVGGFVFPMMAAIHYWLPLVTGRTFDHRLAVPAFWLIFGGFNLTFFPMHLTGLLGMPRRVASYPAEAHWDWLNLASSLGAFLMVMGFALFIIDIAVQLRFGVPTARNPFRARTLEWAVPAPPPSYTFASLPLIDTRADMLDPDALEPVLTRGKGYLGMTRHSWMETLGVDMITGRATQIIVLPRTSYLPLISGLATAGVVLALLFKVYAAALVLLAATLVSLLAWTAGSGTRSDSGALPIGQDETAPPHWESERPPSWWAMAFTLAADATLFASLLFGGLFLWLVAPGSPPGDVAPPASDMVIVCALTLAAAAVAGRRALVVAQAGGYPLAWLAVCTAAHFASAGAFGLLAAGIDQPAIHAHHATILAILVYGGLHAAIGTIFSAYGVYRLQAGFISLRRTTDLGIARLWHDYTLGAGLIALGAVHALAFLAESGVAQ